MLSATPDKNERLGRELGTPSDTDVVIQRMLSLCHVLQLGAHSAKVVSTALAVPAAREPLTSRPN